jgi:integrase
VASLYPKARSPFWWIEFRDASTGHKRNESTKLRKDSPEETRKARQLCAQRTADELAAPVARSGESWSWVNEFLDLKYSDPHTRRRAGNAWFNLTTYFQSRGILNARTLKREHCASYITWRTGPEARKLGLRKAVHNTALLELKILSGIMREAVLRERAAANPCLQLGISRARGKIKAEISPEEEAIIERQLKAEKGKYPYNEAMQISWQIAMLHVCRLSETCVPLSNVNLQEGTITFETKGHREQTKLLHPELVPLFQRLKKSGAKRAYEMPGNWSKKWKNFFVRCGLPHLSFHCTRVTGVTKLRRLGVDKRIARDYVGHSSEIVHAIYQRWRPDDHAAAVKALSRNAPAPSSSEP